MRRRAQSGFTLIELIIAITLVAAISAALLTTMRNALMTMERTQTRLEEARRAAGLQDLVRRQIGAVMPVRGVCGGTNANLLSPVFRGNAARLLLVSSDSLAGGSRGTPSVLLYAVQPNPDGTVRLEVTETPFSGPLSTAPLCAAALSGLPVANVAPVVVYARLAFCRFLYRRMNPDTYVGQGPWLVDWTLPALPYAVRVEMAAAPGGEARMPVGPITVPLRIARLPGVQYGD